MSEKINEQGRNNVSYRKEFMKLFKGRFLLRIIFLQTQMDRKRNVSFAGNTITMTKETLQSISLCGPKLFCVETGPNTMYGNNGMSKGTSPEICMSI